MGRRLPPSREKKEARRRPQNGGRRSRCCCRELAGGQGGGLDKDVPGIKVYLTGEEVNPLISNSNPVSKEVTVVARVTPLLYCETTAL